MADPTFRMELYTQKDSKKALVFMCPIHPKEIMELTSAEYSPPPGWYVLPPKGPGTVKIGLVGRCGCAMEILSKAPLFHRLKEQ